MSYLSNEWPHFTAYCLSFWKKSASAASGYSNSADIIDCHQVMEMTVISSTPSALLIETICSVYRSRHKQTVFLIFLSQAVRLLGSLPAREGDSRPVEKWIDRERIGIHGRSWERNEAKERDKKKKGREKWGQIGNLLLRYGYRSPSLSPVNTQKCVQVQGLYKFPLLQSNVLWMAGKMGLGEFHSRCLPRRLTFGPPMIWALFYFFHFYSPSFPLSIYSTDGEEQK